MEKEAGGSGAALGAARFQWQGLGEANYGYGWWRLLLGMPPFLPFHLSWMPEVEAGGETKLALGSEVGVEWEDLRLGGKDLIG